MGQTLRCGLAHGATDIKAWFHIYRSLQHSDAKTACEAVRNLSFPATIVTCAEAFVTLQQERHDADYNPDYRVLRADALKAELPSWPNEWPAPLASAFDAFLPDGSPSHGEF